MFHPWTAVQRPVAEHFQRINFGRAFTERCRGVAKHWGTVPREFLGCNGYREWAWIQSRLLLGGEGLLSPGMGSSHSGRTSQSRQTLRESVQVRGAYVNRVPAGRLVTGYLPRFANRF